ncbi:MAG TPA: tetratricopeptide repeat-containing sensor histidine kinase, partial [Mucilaginibacter sp.]|nr:tetratricopeptide repeat-containing sensor histidine kinase [Mucilaginibacter sp.]
VFFVSISGFSSLNEVRPELLGAVSASQPLGFTAADTLKINKLNKLAANYFESNPDSTLYYGQKGVELSRAINYRVGLAYGLVQMAHANFFKGRFEQSEPEFIEAILIFKKLNDKNGLAQCYRLYGKMFGMKADYKHALAYLNLAQDIDKKQKNDAGMADNYKEIGIVYFSKGQLTTALDYYYKTLFLEVKENDKNAIADTYNNIGDVLQNMEAYPKALEYYKKALKEAQENKDLLEIGIANENIGEVLLAQKNYNNAIVYLIKSINIAIRQDDKDGLSYINADLGLCYANMGRFKLAMNCLTASWGVAKINKMAYDETYALVSLAEVLNMQKDYKNACKYALRAQDLAVEINNTWFREKAAMQLYNSYAGLGMFKEAFSYSRKYNDLKDSLKSNEGIQKLATFNMSLNLAQKEHQLELQQVERDITYRYNQQIKQQRLNTVFVSIIIAMIIISSIYYRQKQKQKKTIVILGEKNEEILQQKTSLDEQAKKLNDLNTLKDRLISVLAHDLRAPLSTLRGLFDLLQDDTISHQQMLEMIPGVLKKLEYTSDFLDTLLFWINSQMENFESSAKNFFVKDIVAFEADNYQEQAALKGIRLIDSVPDDVVASADPNSIRIVIRNLITNAIKFSREGDTIEIVAEREDTENYVITVKDTGTGMSEEQLKKLFKSKVNSKAGTNNESGTGMGMLFCKDLVERCSGRIWVNSKPGEGTAFSFTVPTGFISENRLEVA